MPRFFLNDAMAVSAGHGRKFTLHHTAIPAIPPEDDTLAPIRHHPGLTSARYL